MYKIRKLLMSVVFMVLGAAIPMTINIISKNNLVIKISQEFYSNKSQAFYVVDSDRNDIEYIMRKMSRGDILYGELSPNFRGVYVKDNDNAFPVIEGRSFKNTDFFTNKKVAMIGRNLLKECISADHKYYYPIRNELFEVIGILGIESESLLDNYLWINLDYMLNITYSDGFYVLEGSEKILQDPILADKIEVVNKEEAGIKAMYKDKHAGAIILICSLFSLLICALIIIMYWLEYQKYTISVKRLCGISNTHIIIDLLWEFVYTCCLGYILGSILTLLLLKNKYYNLNQITFLSIIIFSLTICVFMAFYLKHWTNRFLR